MIGESVYNCVGKRCRTCLVKRGGHCRRLEGLRLYMLWDQVMTGPVDGPYGQPLGGLVVGLRQSLRKESEALKVKTHSLHFPSC